MKRQISFLFGTLLSFSVAQAQVQTLSAPKVKVGRYELNKLISTVKACEEWIDVRLSKSADGDVTVALGNRQGVLWKTVANLSTRQMDCNYVGSQSLTENVSGQTFISSDIEKCEAGKSFMGSQKRTYKFNADTLSFKIESQKGGSQSPWAVESFCNYRFKR